MFTSLSDTMNLLWLTLECPASDPVRPLDRIPPRNLDQPNLKRALAGSPEL